jgi:hypothetical protein
VERGDAERGQFAAACNEQANKRSPTRLSGLVVKSGKGVYRREEYLSVAYLKEEYDRTYKGEVIEMTRMKATLFSCRRSSLSLATPWL